MEPSGAHGERAAEEPGGELVSDAVPDAMQFPCTIISRAEVEDLLGNPTEEPVYSLETVESEGIPFEAQTCAWLTFAEGANEATVQVSRNEHFAGGSVACRDPDSPTTMTDSAQPPADEAGADPADMLVPREVPRPPLIPVDGLGWGAWWRFDRDTAVGRLLACDQDARVAVEISAGDVDDRTARSIALDLARRALAADSG